jgi:hypothetical protein
MVRSLRKTLALVAACAIAVQALLAGYFFAAHADFDPSTFVCSSSGSADHGNAPRHDGADCGGCALACAGAGAIAPPADIVLFIATSILKAHQALCFEAPPAPAKYRAQSPRAPPITA